MNQTVPAVPARWLLAGLWLTAHLAHAQSLSVSGRLVDEDGFGVVGGDVSIEGPLDSGSAAPTRISSGVDGAFSFTNLAPGRYLVCGSLAGSDLLANCEWNPSPPLSVVASVTGLAITIPQGQLVRFRISDPGKHINDNNGKGNGASLLVGVWSSRGFHSARQVDAKPNSREFVIAVPYDKPVRLGVHGRRYDVEDNGGRKVPENLADIEVTSAKPANSKGQGRGLERAFDYRIKGIRP
jgi:hypothetical protein